MLPESAIFPAFVINLDTSSTRMEHMRAELARAGLPFERVQGLVAEDLPARLQPYFFDAGERPSRMKRGEIGCHAAHLSICLLMLERNLPAALILEDDAVLLDGFRAVVTSLHTNLPEHWDVVRLSSPPKRTYVPLRRLCANHLLVRFSTVPNFAGAYLISLSGARKMLQPGFRHLAVDEFMRRPWLNGLDTFGVVPPPAATAGLASDIDAAEVRKRPRDHTIGRNMRKFDPAHTLARWRCGVRTLGLRTWIACAVLNGVDRVAKRALGGSQIDVYARWLARRGARSTATRD